MITMPTVNTKMEQMSWELVGEFEDVLEERRHLRFSKGTKKKTHKYEYLMPNSNTHIETEEQETARQAALIAKFPENWQRAAGFFTPEDFDTVQSRFKQRVKLR